MEVIVRGQNYIEGRARVETRDTEAATAPDIRLRRGATISGRVVDAVTGNPIVNAGVTADGIDGSGRHAHQHTGSNGRYVMRGVAPGSYTIRTDPEGQARDYIQGYYEGSLTREGAKTVTVAGTEVVGDVDFQLGQGATISGRVIDAETGSPIAGMKVRARMPRGDNGSESRTDGQGNYVLKGIPDGVIEVVVEGQGYIEVRRTVTVRDGADVTGFDF